MAEKEKKERKAKGFPFHQLSFSTWLKIFLLVFGLIVGMAIEHYYIEPLISSTVQEKLTECISEKQLLNKEINQCYVDLANAKQT